MKLLSCKDFLKPIKKLIFRGSPPEGGSTEKPRNEKEGNEKKERKERQVFELGKHDVLERDKLNKDYVSQISGSVDFIGYDHKNKPEKFFQDEVTRSCELLLRLYANNKEIFTQSAIDYIEANAFALKKLIDTKPKNKKEFDAAMKDFSLNEVDGPDGVLNLLLAFNRVTAKLKSGELDAMANSQAEQMLKIDLRKRATRSVEVSLFIPAIKEPDISKIRLDIPGIETPQKRMKPDGKLEVHYWYTDKYAKSGPTRDIAISLLIDPKTKMVTVTKYWREPGPRVINLSITDFNKQLGANAYFLHGL